MTKIKLFYTILFFLKSESNHNSIWKKNGRDLNLKCTNLLHLFNNLERITLLLYAGFFIF
jgi:hypothetical protein